MIRALLVPAIGLATGGLLAVMLQKDPGYVLIQIGGYTLESSLAGLALLTAIGLFLAALGWKLFYGSVKLPAKIGESLENRRLNKARLQLRAGLQQLAAGNWQKAEMELLRRISDAEGGATNYLYAAEAAHKQQAPERRDQYLQLALQASDQQSSAVLLKQAQLWADDGRNVDALLVLDDLLKLDPRHAPTLELRLELLRREQRWEDLKSALASAKNLVDDKILNAHAVVAHMELLSAARRTGQLEKLRSAWSDVPKALRHEPSLLIHYAQLTHQMGSDADGLRLLAGELNHHWHPELALCFGDMDGGDIVRQLARAEDWIRRHGEKPELLLVAGRLCLRNRLWGRARSYFEACLKLKPSPELRLELGKLLMMQGEDGNVHAALEMFQQGLESSLKQDTAEQDYLPAALSDKSDSSAVADRV